MSRTRSNGFGGSLHRLGADLEIGEQFHLPAAMAEGCLLTSAT
jgi:hypothetical protein